LMTNLGKAPCSRTASDELGRSKQRAESSELGATANIELGRSELVGGNELDVSFLYCCKGVLFV
jgi:hypothetical protein